METWRWSTESHEALRDGLPMTLADLRDLRGALSDPEWLDALSRSADDPATHDRDR